MTNLERFRTWSPEELALAINMIYMQGTLSAWNHNPYDIPYPLDEVFDDQCTCEQWLYQDDDSLLWVQQDDPIIQEYLELYFEAAERHTEETLRILKNIAKSIADNTP